MRFVGYDHSRTPVDRSGQLGSFTTGRGTEIQDPHILRKLDSIQYQLRGRILKLIRAARTVRGTEAQAAILEEVKNEAELAAEAALQAVENLRNTRR